MADRVRTSILCLLLCCLSSIAAQTNAPAPRLSVAVMPFTNETGDSGADHWGVGLAWLLSDALSAMPGLHLLPREAVDYARTRVEVETSTPPPEVSARRVGELIEARRVVWGRYRRDGNEWQVSARVMHAATGRFSMECKATAAEWFDVRDKLVSQILSELGLRPTSSERLLLTRRPTRSSSAWEQFSLACALEVRGAPLPEQAVPRQRAVELDSDFAAAQAALGAFHNKFGHYAAAEAATRRALQSQPNLQEARVELAVALMFQEKFNEAEKELLEGLHQNSEHPGALLRMGELQAVQGAVDAALQSWEQAERIDSTSALIHARLGEAYARKGNRAAALLQLKLAEQFRPDEPAVQQILARAYDLLNETRTAIGHGEKFLALTRRQGGNPALLPKFEERVRELKAMLTPQPVAAVMPREFTEAALTEALHSRLTPDEVLLATNPLAPTPDMQRIVDNLTRGLSDDWSKAQKILEALAQRAQRGQGGSRTAAEVFTGWSDPRLSFRCQETARLYVALARLAGLKAFYTTVEKDHQGRGLLHACACVFLNGKAWLVDPTYRWFGVVHQGFTVLDDFQAVAVHLQQQPRDIPRLRLGVKLMPEFAPARFNLAVTLLFERKLEEANAELQAGLKLEPETWVAHWTQGYFAALQGQPGKASGHFQQCLKLNPDFDKAQYFLADCLLKQGKLPEAREGYRAYLRQASDPTFNEKARQAIASINEKLGPN